MKWHDANQEWPDEKCKFLIGIDLDNEICCGAFDGGMIYWSDYPADWRPRSHIKYWIDPNNIPLPKDKQEIEPCIVPEMPDYKKKFYEDQKEWLDSCCGINDEMLTPEKDKP